MISENDDQSVFLILIAFIALITPFYIYYLYSVSDGADVIWNHTHPTVQAIERYSNYRQPLIIILLWTPIKKNHNWTPDERLNDCNCLVTWNRSHLSQAHLVVFHWKFIDSKDLPQIKPPGQLWIWLSRESPMYTRRGELLRQIGRYFDCWASHRKDSDFVLDYGRFVGTSSSRRQVKVSLASKNKSIAWIVNHCNANSGRDDYAKQLAQYIEVDIYGKCGQLKFGDYNYFKNNTWLYQLIERDYKFYLSFENSICKDYVTEKTFTWLNYTVIPIVFGGGDYATIMPNHSYIDALDYPSPKDLAQYLEQLSADEESYNRYLDWKSTGLKPILLNLDNYSTIFCTIVDKLRLSSINGLEICNRTFQNLYNWWFNEAQCQSWKPDEGLVPVAGFP